MKDQLILGGLTAFLLTSALLNAQVQPGAVLWTYDAGATISSSPALTQDGTVYIAAGYALCAVTNSGTTASNKWTVPLQVSGSPAIGTDGTVWFRGQLGPLYAVNPDGSQKWSFSGAAGRGGSPAVGSDNTVYLFSGGWLYAIGTSGVKKWESFIGNGGSDNTPLSPVVGTDGTIYVADSAVGTLCAFGPDGIKKWSVDLRSSGPGAESPALGGDGTVYYAFGYLSAVSPAGTNLWVTDYQWFRGPPAVGPGGVLYVAGVADIPLWAVTFAGQPGWGALGPGFVNITTPAVDAGGALYYCISNSIWALTAEGQVRWAVTSPSQPPPGGDLALTSPIIGPDGTIYTALGTRLYAIVSGTNGPAKSPWPMYRQNARHTGKVEKPVLKPPQKRSDANFEFQLYPQQFGLTYTVESSSNLYNWTSVTSFVANMLPTDVVDLTASNAPARFYRAFSGP